jgi:isoleucyl-tRNA synthetase
LLEGEYELKLVPTDPESSAALPGEVGVVVLDTEVTAELAAEGLARDVIRAVQQARRDAGLDVSDRIRLVLDTDADVQEAVEANRDLVTSETLTTELVFGEAEGGESVEVADGAALRLTVTKA